MRWCDLTCPEASFPRQEAGDGAGSCRTFSALHCRVLDRLVAKNAPCAVQAQPAKKEKNEKRR
jgi:hypothetical protein